MDLLVPGWTLITFTALYIILFTSSFIALYRGRLSYPAKLLGFLLMLAAPVLGCLFVLIINMRKSRTTHVATT